MNDTDTSQAIGSLDDLEQKARDAAKQLTQASGHNAIWDKATKAIRPGLADLEKARGDAKREAEQADKLVKDLEGNYDSEASGIVRNIREAVDAEISTLWTNMDTAEKAFNTAKQAATDAKLPLEVSTANFEAAQRKLTGLSKDIQNHQKQMATLQTELKDADNKHQLVEAVVKLEDLKKEIAASNNAITDETESKLWQDLNAAADDLILKTNALLDAQGKVPEAETAYKAAKTEYENAAKVRLDTIKQRLADEEEAEEESTYKPVAS